MPGEDHDPDDPTGTAGYRRHESAAHRLDRNFAELLQELRVAQAGVQILFAFLLTIAFQPRFDELSPYQRDIYVVVLVLSVVSVVCFVAPVAAHRVVFRRGVKDSLVTFTSRTASAGLVAMILTVLGGVLLVIDLLLNVVAAVIIVGVLALLTLVLWVLVPLRLRGRG